MSRIVAILFLLLVFSLVTSAQNGKFELKAAGNGKISYFPGVTTNMVIRLVNNSKVDELISLKLKLPRGWKCFSDLKNIQVPYNNSEIKILSLNIPSYTKADNYWINIEAFDLHGGKIDEIKLPLTVEPKYALKVDLVNGPENAFAGDTVSVQFMVQNLSNSNVKIAAIFKGTGSEEKINFAACVSDWNFFAEKNKKPKIEKLTTTRETKIRNRLKEVGFHMQKILQEADKSEFITGEKGGWFTFDWVINNESNYQKVLEGNYKNSQNGNGTTKAAAGRYDHLKAAVAEKLSGTSSQS